MSLRLSYTRLSGKEPPEKDSVIEFTVGDVAMGKYRVVNDPQWEGDMFTMDLEPVDG